MGRTSKSKNDAWYKWEEEVAGILDTIPVPGSGNQPWQKGDVASNYWLVDCKQTEKNSYSISKSFWEEYQQKAKMEDREFAVAINLNGKRIVALDFDAFIALLESLNYK